MTDWQIVVVGALLCAAVIPALYAAWLMVTAAAALAFRALVRWLLSGAGEPESPDGEKRRRA